MKTLWLLRHAKSSWSDASLRDHERPLNDRGLRAAAAVGTFMKQRKLNPDLVLCSSAVRTRQTLQILSDTINLSSDLSIREGLYLSDTQNLIKHIRPLDDTLNGVMIIGHNPGLEELLAYLTGVAKRMPTAALAQIEMKINKWGQFGRQNSGRLRWLITPKELQR